VEVGVKCIPEDKAPTPQQTELFLMKPTAMIWQAKILIKYCSIIVELFLKKSMIKG
jgi:hypothetical protein